MLTAPSWRTPFASGRVQRTAPAAPFAFPAATETARSCSAPEGFPRRPDHTPDPMSADTVFSIANLAVMPGWLLLVFAPAWRWTTKLIAPVLLPGLLGLAYITLFASQLGTMDGGFGSLEEVMRLFGNEWLVVVGWIHYLAFDLFIGSWEVRNARALGIPHALVIPCLVLTLMAGPAGLVLYLVVRRVTKKTWAIEG